MNGKDNTMANRLYYAAFIFLTFLCWSPYLYGRYGEVGLIFGMPSWAALAFLFGAILFILEWIYLFGSGLALSDEKLSKIVLELKS